MKFSELMEKIKAGEIDQSKVRIRTDNDCTIFGIRNGQIDEERGWEEDDAFDVEEGERSPRELLEAALVALGFTDVEGV